MQGSKKVVVEFDSVYLRYTKEDNLLKNVSFKIQEGDFYFLTGKSGAGKTTLLNIINLSLNPSGGFVSLFGKDVATIGARKRPYILRQMGLIFQDFKLIDSLNVFQNIALPLRILNEKEDAIKSKVHEMLEWVNMKEYADAYPNVLSGGQQQIVAMARAVINKPKLILADEATAGVGYEMEKNIIFLLEELASQGTSVVFATHNNELVKKSSNKNLHIQDHTVKRITKYIR